MTYRRDFLKWLLVAPTAPTLLLKIASADPLKYPLKSTLDFGTTLDEKKASLARQITESIITKDRQKGLKWYKTTGVYVGPVRIQVTDAKMRINDFDYGVNIVAVGDSPESDYFNQILIVREYADSEKYRESRGLNIATLDTGLDGRCDQGNLRRGGKIAEEEREYHAKSKNYPEGIGLEYQEEFQKFYEENLEALAEFYEVRKKA